MNERPRHGYDRNGSHSEGRYVCDCGANECYEADEKWMDWAEAQIESLQGDLDLAKINAEMDTINYLAVCDANDTLKDQLAHAVDQRDKVIERVGGLQRYKSSCKSNHTLTHKNDEDAVIKNSALLKALENSDG